MGGETRQDDHDDPQGSQDQARDAGLVGPHDNVVHVPGKTGDHYHEHMNRNEAEVPEQEQEVDRAGTLATAEDPRIPREAAVQAGDMASPVRIESGGRRNTTLK